MHCDHALPQEKSTRSAILRGQNKVQKRRPPRPTTFGLGASQENFKPLLDLRVSPSGDASPTHEKSSRLPNSWN
eukprot:s523_g7.t1